MCTYTVGRRNAAVPRRFDVPRTIFRSTRLQMRIVNLPEYCTSDDVRRKGMLPAASGDVINYRVGRTVGIAYVLIDRDLICYCGGLIQVGACRGICYRTLLAICKKTNVTSSPLFTTPIINHSFIPALRRDSSVPQIFSTADSLPDY